MGKHNEAKKLASKIAFDFGDTVVFNNKVGKDEGIVCNIRLCPGCILYSVVWSDKTVKDHYDFELKLKDI